MTTLTEIGAYEAKTHLPEFLRKVRAGSAFRITQRGEPVADLIPSGASERQNAAQGYALYPYVWKPRGWA